MNAIRLNQAGRPGLRDQPAAPKAVHLSRSTLIYLLSIAFRRRWIILGTTAATVMIAIIFTLLATPQFKASSTIEIQRENRNLVSMRSAEAAAEASSVDLEFYQTQYGLLRSRSLADRVATDLRLFDSADFFDAYGTSRQKDWFDDGKPLIGASKREQRIRAAGDLLLKRISIDPGRLSRLVDIEITTYDPQLSKRIVDQWSTDFIQETLARRYDASSYARKFLDNRLNQLRARIDQSERQLVDYASAQGIVNIPIGSQASGDSAPSTAERPLAADDLTALNRALAQATADRIEAESKLSGNAAAAPETVQNVSIGRLREQRAELAAEYAKLMAQFEPNYPPALNLQSQIAQADRSIAREEARVRDSLQQTYAAASRAEAGLKARVGMLKSGVLDLRRRSIQYNIYQREVDTNRQLYDALLQRYKEIGVAGGVGINNIAIVDEAEAPVRPSSPNLLLNLAIGILAGLALGIAAALAAEQVDEAVADPSDVQEFDLPLLGTTPRLTEDTPAETLRDPKSALAEAYLSLQTNLAFSTDHGVPRTIAVTSSRPAEGKTTTTFALARSLARAGKRTLLIDGDMRSPSVHGLVGISNERGVSNFLSGDEDVTSLIAPVDESHFFAMAAGPQPPSAAELLTSTRLARLLEVLGRDFDHILIDAPPVMGLADAPLIGHVVEGVVFVIESGRTKKSAARVAVERLRSANVHLLGFVLTKFNAKRSRTYGYDYGYGYGTEPDERRVDA